MVTALLSQFYVGGVKNRYNQEMIMALLALGAALAQAQPRVLAPHRRPLPRPHSYDLRRSTDQARVDYNGGEITAGFTDDVKSVIVYDESVSTRVAPAFAYTSNAILRHERLRHGVSIVRYKAADYAEAAQPPNPNFHRAGTIEVNGGACPLYETKQTPPQYFGFLYADAAGKDRKPFYYYFIYTSGPRGDFGNLEATELWVKTLRIRPPGSKGTPMGCLDFAPPGR